MQEAIAQIRSHDTHKLLSAKAAFLRLSPDEKARFARFFEAEARGRMLREHQRESLGLCHPLRVCAA